MRKTSIYKTFRIYVRRGLLFNKSGRRFWKVNVFKSESAMYNYARSIGELVGNGFGAQVVQLYVPHHFKQGTISFFRSNINGRVVAHEMAHVAIAMTPKKRRNIFKNRRDGERFCRLLDSLVEQFWKHYGR